MVIINEKINLKGEVIMNQGKNNRVYFQQKKKKRKGKPEPPNNNVH